MNKTFNYYCDESTHLENDGMPFMLISYVSSPINQVKQHAEHVKMLRAKHKFKGEIKWSNVSNGQYPFYAELIEYFFATDLTFRAIIVEKNQIDNEKHGSTYDEFYFRMYYQLLFHKMSIEHAYNIYLDIKDTCSSKKIRKLKEELAVDYRDIRTIQAMRSHESVLMQLTDLLMGAINYNLRGLDKVIAKKKLIEKIEKQSGVPLTRSTHKNEDKLNLFFIDLNPEK